MSDSSTKRTSVDCENGLCVVVLKNTLESLGFGISSFLTGRWGNKNRKVFTILGKERSWTVYFLKHANPWSDWLRFLDQMSSNFWRYQCNIAFKPYIFLASRF